MLANFLIFGILVAISNQAPHLQSRESIGEPFRKPVARLDRVLGAAAATLLGFAAYYQVARDQDFLSREAKVFEDDGVKRPAAKSTPEFAGARDPARQHFRPKRCIARHQRLERTGAASRSIFETRCLHRYCVLAARQPALSFWLADGARPGDFLEREFHATNASLIEHDSNEKLQGFMDYRQLAPLIRYRHQPGNPEIAKLLARDRNVTSSIDIRLQMRAARRWANGWQRRTRIKARWW